MAVLVLLDQIFHMRFRLLTFMMLLGMSLWAQNGGSYL